ncbi:hypothetical protein [Virgibacillus halodenitrificans]|uniref:hypothetical protein n=1 Tax=Virgibacillus halodenitrificans TaxID=1482 RepID=UPI000EF524AD|nr:hypothetical protein [Virgibacillus halodenitrificans]
MEKRKLNIKFVTTTISIIGFISSIIAIYLAINNLDFVIILLIIMGIALLVLTTIFCNLLFSAKKLTKDYNELIQRNEEIEKRHHALSNRFDEILEEKDELQRNYSQLEAFITFISMQGFDKQDFQNLLTYMNSIRGK